MMDKIIDTNAAMNAYSNSQGLGSGKTVAGSDGVSFSDFLEETARDSLETMKEGERMSAKAVTGEADLTDVVEAVTASEITLQTIVSIRDRLVSAYQEIMRIPI